MAEQYHGFWDGGALYGQVEFNRYFDRIYESGVSVRADGSMEYEVKKASATHLDRCRRQLRDHKRFLSVYASGYDRYSPSRQPKRPAL